MKAYNINDVLILERVYLKLRPWIKNHPNIAVHDDDVTVCPNCGGNHLEKRGFSVTQLGKYQRYHCRTCGTWSRDRKNFAVKGALNQDKN
jgi:rubredoxin